MRRMLTLTNHYTYQKMKVPTNNHKRLGCLIAIQITRVIMTNDKVKRNINNILLTIKQTTTLKKNGDKINNLCGSRKWEVPVKQLINKSSNEVNIFAQRFKDLIVSYHQLLSFKNNTSQNYNQVSPYTCFDDKAFLKRKAM